MAQKATLKLFGKTERKTYMKEPKNAVVRARCAVALKQSVEEIARLQKIDAADVIRIALESYVSNIQAAFRGQPPRIGA